MYHSPAANAVTAIFRARPVVADASVRLDFESNEHVWVSRTDVRPWLPRIAFPAMARALEEWSRSEPA